MTTADLTPLIKRQRCSNHWGITAWEGDGMLDVGLLGDYFLFSVVSRKSLHTVEPHSRPDLEHGGQHSLKKKVQQPTEAWRWNHCDSSLIALTLLSGDY
jgi:hypothetical protein